MRVGGGDAWGNCGADVVRFPLSSGFIRNPDKQADRWFSVALKTNRVAWAFPMLRAGMAMEGRGFSLQVCDTAPASIAGSPLLCGRSPPPPAYLPTKVTGP